MRLLVYLPDDPKLREGLDEILRRAPKVRRIEGTAALEDEIAAADPKAGFVVVNPPRGAEDLKRLDDICRRRLGKQKLPRAVFFAPKKPDADYRAAMKEPYHHFHQARRSYPFKKPTAKALGQAVKIASKADSLLRWGLLGPMAATTLVLGLGLFLFRDAILRKVAVEGLQMAFGARADVPALASTITPAFHLGDVAVADAKKPMTNLFQFDRLKADVGAGPLFSGRLHADELTLEGLRFGGDRTESGALPGVVPPPEPPPPDPAASPTFEKGIEDLLKRLEPPALDDLHTVRRAREIEQESRDRLARYDAMSGKLEKARQAGDAIKNLKMPASVDDAVKAVSGLRPDAGMVEKARADLDAAQALDLAAEAKSVEAARADVESVKKSLDDTKVLVENAKEIKKPSITDTPKILALIQDLGKAQKSLDGAGAKLDNAQKTLEKSRQEVARKQQEAGQKLAAADESLASARKSLDSSSPEGLSKLGPQLAQAKKDLEKYRGELDAKVKSAKDEMDSARRDLEDFRKTVQGDLEFMRQAPASLQEAMEKDRAELAKRYDVKNLNAEELIKALFGEEAVKYLHWALEAHRMIQPYLSRPKQPKPGKTVAGRGAIYAFPVPEEPRQPRVWIKKGTFKGAVTLQGEKGTIEGSATNLSSDPALVGEEGRLEVRLAAGARILTLAIKVSPKGELSADIAAEGFSLGSGGMKNKYLSADVGSGVVAVRASLAFGDASLRANGSASLTGLRVQPAPGLDSKLSFLGDLVKGLDHLDARFEAEGSAKGLSSFKVQSDQAGDLSGKLRGALSGRMEEAKQKAFAGLDAQVADPRKQAEEAAARFLGQAPGKADSVTGGLPADGAAPGAEALARADSLGKLLSGNVSSDEMTAAVKKDLDALAARSASQKDKNAKDGATQTAAADAALKGAGAQKDQLAAVKAEVTAQIDRLKKLK
jgi:hypothetical protein